MPSRQPIPSNGRRRRGQCNSPSGAAPGRLADTRQPSTRGLTYDAWERLKGAAVYSADAVRLGIVTSIYHPLRYRVGERNNHYLLVRSGHRHIPFTHHFLYVPETALRHWSSQRIELTLDADQILHDGWARVPSDLTRFHRS